jgi:hypothetical protein
MDDTQSYGPVLTLQLLSGSERVVQYVRELATQTN